MEIVPRREWGARPPNELVKLATPVPYVFIHRTGGSGKYETPDECIKKLKKLQRIDMDEKKHDDIGYNFIIGGDGRIYTGRGWNYKGKHTIGHNKKSLGIAFMGDFMKEEPTLFMVRAAQELINFSVEQGYLTKDYKLYGHRIVSPGTVECPGNKLYNLIREWPHFTEDYEYRLKR